MAGAGAVPGAGTRQRKDIHDSDRGEHGGVRHQAQVGGEMCSGSPADVHRKSSGQLPAVHPVGLYRQPHHHRD